MVINGGQINCAWGHNFSQKRPDHFVFNRFFSPANFVTANPVSTIPVLFARSFIPRWSVMFSTGRPKENSNQQGNKMTDWTNYKNPGHLNPFDYEAFSHGYSQYGQGNHTTAQSPASSRPQSPASSRAESQAPSPELQVLKNKTSDRKSADAARRPPRAPTIFQKFRKKLSCSSTEAQIDTQCIRTRNTDRNVRSSGERTRTRVDYAQGSSSTPPSVVVYQPDFEVDTSVLQSPGTRDTHEMYWQSLNESEYAPPFDSIGGAYANPDPWSYGAEAQGNMYMPVLPPLSPSPWDAWMQEDDLALREAAATYGAAEIAQLSYTYNMESAQAQEARANLIGTLSTALADLEGLVNSNTDAELAEYPIKQLDRQITPLLIASENWRRPHLNLVALHTSEAATVDSDDEAMDELSPMAGSQEIDDFVENAPPGRYRALIDNGQHTRVADIHKSESGVSVIVLDSLRVEDDEKEYEDYAIGFKEDFGTYTNAKCAYIPLDLQKSAFGCRIFSMSLALKMQSREGEFTSVHNALYGNSDLADIVPESKPTDDDENAHVILNAGSVIDASMMKHNESRSSIKKFLRANPDQNDVDVNNRGETLNERTKRHTISRKVLDKKGPEGQKRTKNITYNNSIELKRIALIKRALNFVSVAPPDEIIQLSARIDN